MIEALVSLCGRNVWNGLAEAEAEQSLLQTSVKTRVLGGDLLMVGDCFRDPGHILPLTTDILQNNYFNNNFSPLS
jgi:hypothetical protein